MVHVDRVPEPPDFDQKARQPGRKWIADHPEADRPRDYWSPFKPALAAGFRNLCGYTALHTPVGTIDHYISCREDASLAYEWDNYRFAAGWINSSKRNADDTVLDPYEVEDGWFEILLPSMQMVATPAVPAHLRAKADYTLERLHLRDDERVIRLRRTYYDQYLEGKLSLEGLRGFAPLIATAIERKQQQAATA